MNIHPTIAGFQEAAASGDHDAIAALLAGNVSFMPPTYLKTWTGRAPVAAIPGHVGAIFSDFSYRRVMGAGDDWVPEFARRVGALDAVGVDLITLDRDGLIEKLEVAVRPLKTVAALREAMNARVSADPRLAGFRAAQG